MIRNLLICLLFKFTLRSFSESVSAMRASAFSFRLSNCSKSNSPPSICRTLSTKSGDEADSTFIPAGILAAITASTGFLASNSSDTESDSNERDSDAAHGTKKMKASMKKSPSQRARKRILFIEKPSERITLSSPNMNFSSLSPRKNRFVMSENLFDNNKSFKACNKERQADLEEIEKIKKFVQLDLEDLLNKKLALNVVEGSSAMLLSIRHGLFLRAYGLICKGCLPYVIFDDQTALNAADFIAEIVKATDSVHVEESELQIVMDLISNIYKTAGSDPEVLLKAKSVAQGSKNKDIVKHLFDVGGFVSQLYPVSFNSPSSENPT